MFFPLMRSKVVGLFFYIPSKWSCNLMTLKLQYFQFASGFLIASTKLPYLMFQDLFSVSRDCLVFRVQRCCNAVQFSLGLPESEITITQLHSVLICGIFNPRWAFDLKSKPIKDLSEVLTLKPADECIQLTLKTSIKGSILPFLENLMARDAVGRSGSTISYK